MKKKLFSLVTGVAMLAGTVSSAAYATPNVTLVDIMQQAQEASVLIQGQTSYSDVLVKVIQPDHTILYLDDLIVTNGNFQKSLTLSASAPLGEYTVVVGQDHSVATDTFTVIAKRDSGGSLGGVGGGPSTSAPVVEPPAPSKNPTIPVVVNSGQSQQRVPTQSAKSGNTIQASLTDADLQAALSGSTNTPIAVVASVASEKGQTAELTLSSQQVKLLSNTPGATLVATSGSASVALPSSMLNQVKDGDYVKIVIGEDTHATSTFTSQAAGASVVGTPMSYEVYLMHNGQPAPIGVQSKSYIKRSFMVDADLDPLTAGALYIENGIVHPVPATFTKNEDGTWTVMVNRPGFSTYAVATRSVTFTDTNSSYAKDQIQTLANKFLINGTTATTFSPKLGVTRAQFAAMLSRAIGLQAKSAAPFADVHASDWFAKDVAAAYEAGLVQGVGNSRFNPNAQIKRQDLTVMLAKAIQLLNMPKKANALTVSYSDANQFASYAKDSIGKVTESGLMKGELVNGSYVFHPNDPTTREAAATVLYSLLKNAKLINE